MIVKETENGASFNNVTKINKVQTAVKKGYKLGSTGATWKKIKQVTSVSSEGSKKSASLDTNGNGTTNVGVDTTDDGSRGSGGSNDVSGGEEGVELESKGMVEFGKLGEVFFVDPGRNLLDIWYWTPPVLQGDEEAKSRDFSGDTLYFHNQCDVSMLVKSSPRVQRAVTTIHSVHLISGDLNSVFKFLIVYKDSQDKVFRLQIHDVNINSESSDARVILHLPDMFYEDPDTELKISLNSRFIVVGNNSGYLYVFRFDDILGNFTPINTNDHLKNLRKNTCLPILRHHKLLGRIADDSVLFKTSCHNGSPIFILNNNWLVYSPTKVEYNQIKISRAALTPVRLPSSKPALNRVLESLSNNALDSLFKLSKFSNKKIQDYLKNKNSKMDLNALKNSLNKLMNQTYNTISDTIEAVGDNQIIKIVDLSNDKLLTVFRAPDGVSNVSFNPYDLQLVNSTFRGDNFFIWDLIKLPEEISLMGKFVRGKTSGIIDDIFWFISNNEDESKVSPILKGTNSGFGCINSRSGTIHWYNINYLLSNLNNNYPTYLGKEFPINLEPPSKNEFLDSWLLSSESSSRKYRKLLKLPDLKNLSPSNLHRMNQLAVIDESNNLKLINPLNGSNFINYELPTAITNPALRPDSKLASGSQQCKPKTLMPLSQIEIETTKPFMNLMNFKNIQISNYDFKVSGVTKEDQFLGKDTATGDNTEESGAHTAELDAFLSHYANLTNNCMPVQTIKVDQSYSPPPNYVEDLIEDLSIE